MILDTNALSALVDGDARLEPILRLITRCAVPVIVLGEYRYGIAQSRHRGQYEEWLHRYLHLFEILPVTESTSEQYAAIRLALRQLGTPIPSNDAWIAALAREYRMSIVSRDAHFDHVADIKRIDF